LLDEARAMTAGKAESSRQIQAKLEIARAYSRIEATVGLEIVEPLIPQLNDLLGAAEVLNGFDQQFYKDGELIWQGTSLSNLVSQVIGDLAALAPEQFDKASDLASRFHRPEVRLSAQLAVAQAILSERSGANYGIDDMRVIGSLKG
jgi:hypothetical protein